ncbi:MAG: hypothetical protein KDI79_07315 [Anaerolineae bacterium]|nr:hypothetical protein [Anaerolineae bacterium]
MSNLPELLYRVRQELGASFISTSIVDGDGMAIAGDSISPTFDTSAVSARFAMVMKLGNKIGHKLNLGPVEDNLVVTTHVFVLSRFLGDGSYYWNLVVTKEATLGHARILMDEYAGQLWAAIPR